MPYCIFARNFAEVSCMGSQHFLHFLNKVFPKNIWLLPAGDRVRGLGSTGLLFSRG